MGNSYNNSVKTSELARITNINIIEGLEDQFWIPVAYYNSLTNSYNNLAINLSAILSYSNSYSYNLFSYEMQNIAYVIENSNVSYSYVEAPEIDYDQIYDICYTYINSVYADKLAYLIANQRQKPSSSSAMRSNSKKISELKARDVITYHKDHSWFPVAQYDSRIDSYVNLAMNLESITSYSINTIKDDYKDIEQLKGLAYSYNDNSEIAYVINNSNIANNIVSYTFAYNKDYFEWQFL